jgi:hypothetical protein
MVQQTDRKKGGRVLLAVGVPLMVAVLGVSLAWAGGSARPDDGQSIILGTECTGSGGTNCETNPTIVENTSINEGFGAEATDGFAGLYGSNISNASTVGEETAGVYGLGAGTGDDGVYGNGLANGVFGETSNNSASGVYGQNGGTGSGVAGRASSGTGVLGDSANGTGVWASSQNATALKVTGKAQFSRSGVATVAGTSAAPAKSVRVSLPITAKSMMTALLQKFVAGVYVVAAVPNVSGGYFTIYLNKAVSTSVGPIAWIVTERP